MTAAVAIVFLLNGIQVDLPAPALLIGDNSYVPARAVFQRLGWEVGWNGERQQMRVGVKGQATYVFTVGNPTVIPESGACVTAPRGVEKTLAAPPQIISGLVYVPVSAVALVTGAQAEWDGTTMTVNLVTRAAGEPRTTDIVDIVADPPAWVGRVVRVRGEYTGWQADPFDPVVSQGPPVTRSDWTLRGDGGSLYCTRAPGAQQFSVSLSPLGDLGRRLEVVGTVALASEGRPYLQVTAISPLSGLPGITCYLTTDRHAYAPGDTVRMQMLVRNPTAEAIVLRFPTSQQYDFTVRDADGKPVWIWSQNKLFAQMLTQKALPPGEEYTVSTEWAIPGDLAPGRYHVSGTINREVRSYVKTVSVAKEE